MTKLLDFTQPHVLRDEAEYDKAIEEIDWLLLTTGTFGGFFLVVITVVNTVLLYRTDQGEIAWPLWSLPWAGLLVTLAFGWVWWRVLETFFTFLRDHYRFAPSRE